MKSGIETVAEKAQGKIYVCGYGGVEDKSTWVRLQPHSKNLQWAELSFNPVVTFTSLAIILAFAAWAMVLPARANAEFANWQSWVGHLPPHPPDHSRWCLGSGLVCLHCL